MNFVLSLGETITYLLLENVILILSIDSAGALSNLSRFLIWIKRCKPLWRELEGMGYDANTKYLPPKMVNAIFEYLGEPGC